MARQFPAWIAALGEEDLGFLKRFLLESGSLKALASDYGVSYPTLRARLDRLIDRVRLADTERLDPFRARMRELVARGDVSSAVARELLTLHEEQSVQKENEQ